MHDRVDVFLLDRATGYYQLGIKEDGSVNQGEAAAMLFAFACELVLKGLGATEKRHHLRQLLDSLPHARQEWLNERYSNLEGRELSHDIDSCSDLFREIRYWNEQGGGAVGCH